MYRMSSVWNYKVNKVIFIQITYEKKEKHQIRS